MRKLLPFITFILCISILYGCDKEKILTTTETVHDTEYVELPPDTVLIADTLYLSDSVEVNITDTLFLTDSIIVNNTDTVVFNTTDTLTVYDTIIETQVLVDTVEINHNIYDTVTVTVIDTVIQNNVTPDASYAYSALQYQTDPAVIQFVNSEFGVTDGWVLYLSSFQNQVSNPSVGVYDFYGVIDYWTTDWASYYPLEYNWRVSYIGGDPSDPQNWQLTEPPTTTNGNSGGVTLVTNRASATLK